MSGIATIVGTAAGFFAGVYMPIGAVPSGAQALMKMTPFPYLSPDSVAKAVSHDLHWQARGCKGEF
jgi:ABC-type uncharacterized transport system permease subunit